MHLPNNHQSQFAGFAHKTSKINKIKNPDKPVVVSKLSPLSIFELMAWQVYACIEMPHHVSEHEKYMFRSFALWDHSLLREWCLTGPGITLDSLRRFLIELWNTSKEIRYRWLISEIITGMLNPLTCTKKDIGKLEGAQKSCTDNSKFQKLEIHETSAQPSVVLLKQMFRVNLRLQVNSYSIEMLMRIVIPWS